MTDETTAGLLEAVRMPEDGAFELARDPRATAALGSLIAQHATELRPDIVLSWHDVDDVVLAHAVAAELGVPRSVLELDLGLITASPALVEGTRALLVSTRFSTFERPIVSIGSMLSSRGQQLVGAATLEANGNVELPEGIPFLTIAG